MYMQIPKLKTNKYNDSIKVCILKPLLTKRNSTLIK